MRWKILLSTLPVLSPSFRVSGRGLPRVGVVLLLSQEPSLCPTGQSAPMPGLDRQQDESRTSRTNRWIIRLADATISSLSSRCPKSGMGNERSLSREHSELPPGQLFKASNISVRRNVQPYDRRLSVFHHVYGRRGLLQEGVVSRPRRSQDSALRGNSCPRLLRTVSRPIQRPRATQRRQLGARSWL